MKRIKKRVTNYENVFIANDGTEFPYEAEAREYELQAKAEKLKKLESIKNGILPFANAKYTFYRAEDENDYNMILDYFVMKYGLDAETLRKHSKKLSFPEWYGVFESFGENPEDNIHIGDCLCFTSLNNVSKMISNFKDQFSL